MRWIHFYESGTLHTPDIRHPQWLQATRAAPSNQLCGVRDVGDLVFIQPILFNRNLLGRRSTCEITLGTKAMEGTPISHVCLGPWDVKCVLRAEDAPHIPSAALGVIHTIISRFANDMPSSTDSELLDHHGRSCTS